MEGIKRLSFHILGIDVHIDTDSMEFLKVFEANYFRFISNPPVCIGKALVFKVMETSREGSHLPVLIFEGKEHLLPRPEMAGSHFTGHIFHEIQQRVTSHILIHAGVVSRDGQGIVLAADSGHGKTTFVIEMVRRGYAFLSDEMAAIHRTVDGSIRSRAVCASCPHRWNAWVSLCHRTAWNGWESTLLISKRSSLAAWGSLSRSGT